MIPLRPKVGGEVCDTTDPNDLVDDAGAGVCIVPVCGISGDCAINAAVAAGELVEYDPDNDCPEDVRVIVVDFFGTKYCLATPDADFSCGLFGYVEVEVRAEDGGSVTVCLPENGSCVFGTCYAAP